jgi:hypothetical protein
LLRRAAAAFASAFVGGRLLVEVGGALGSLRCAAADLKLFGQSEATVGGLAVGARTLAQTAAQWVTDWRTADREDASKRAFVACLGPATAIPAASRSASLPHDVALAPRSCSPGIGVAFVRARER